MRQVVLDTETTGLDPMQGHKIIEIGCVEIQNRKRTDSQFHCYLNPEREIDEAAIEVHGLTVDFLADKPHFHQVEQEFIDFITGAELIIHNAPFDLGFLNHELALTDSPCSKLDGICTVLDTLLLAREIHPGQRNSLDALCKRYTVDNTQRTLHGALLDAEILADVYLAMTSGQSSLFHKEEQTQVSRSRKRVPRLDPKRPTLPIFRADSTELQAHQQRLDEIAQDSTQGCLWQQLEIEQ
ncbi:MAG TPA: DNA polymerase III subunit epsilon [Gammaproteobacteria bacterium]|jgi:DNA polymerase-3 subunit epsilon|nr:DNA polymerase III subunit epsilon [Gammaproteobacteria bacterium]MDP6732261.1 DNA polymerase III subunit epsilon [Gammaproteobacteria bacterium]HAJ75000.1 DNA polymerase III subunit epsilon [Gammaproteobacteria bacterium]